MSASRRLGWSIRAMFLYATWRPIDRLDASPALPAKWSANSSILQLPAEVGKIRPCPVSPGDGARPGGALLRRSLSRFPPMDTKADFLVTSVRINNVILCRISRAAGGVCATGASNALGLASSQVYRLAL
jgi:hypothetical protein